MKVSLATVCLDCQDAHVMAAFYAGLLGLEATITEPDWVLMRHPAGGTGLSFQAEPAYVEPGWPEEPAAQQKMLHLEIRVSPATEAALQEAVERARRLAAGWPSTSSATICGWCSTRPGTPSACSSTNSVWSASAPPENARVTTIADVLPILGLRVSAGPIELRGITDDDLVTLAELAVRGVHPPERMPFTYPVDRRSRRTSSP